MKSNDDDLNQMILAGKAMDGLEKHYSDDVEMCENFDPPCVGKAANRQRELDFFSQVGELHRAEILASAYDENNNVSLSEWVWDLTFKGGSRVEMRQVAVRRWGGGKIVHERFYYNKQQT